MTAETQVGLLLEGVYDAEGESVGITATPTEGFESGDHAQAKVELLAAMAAKANYLAAEIIGTWSDDEERRRALFDHFAALKEHMLNDMLEGNTEEA